MEASVSFHHKSFTQINIHSKQQQVEVPLINVFFMLVPVLNAPELLNWLSIRIVQSSLDRLLCLPGHFRQIEIFRAK